MALFTRFISIGTIAFLANCGKSGNGSAANDPSGAATASPSISFSPTSGPVGTLLTVTGSNFDLSGATSVTINGTVAIIVAKTTGMTTALVMPGTTNGAVTVVTGSGNQTSSSSFSISAASTIATQQGSKLAATDNIGAARIGHAVAASSDGNTLVATGYSDNSDQGAAWIFTRAGTTWSQQGSKLVGTGNTGAARQGYSVAISADGNTVASGGYADNGNRGAVWIFSRTDAAWSQQGTKLVGTGNTGIAGQGLSVALSADGNTLLIGGYTDNSSNGAAWVFVRNGTTWSQQGTKLVGTGNAGAARQGCSVALSADGNTALIGGYTDNSNAGAAWVFTRTGTTWSQQGSKLLGSGNTGAASQGYSVSLSADGNTALIGGYTDNSSQGAAWVFIRTGTTWAQEGSKLVGTGNTGAAWQGQKVALTADGNIAFLGGPKDSSDQGAAWIFTRSGTTWSQQGSKLVGTGNTGAALQGFSIAVSSDGKTAFSGGYNDNASAGGVWAFVP